MKLFPTRSEYYNKTLAFNNAKDIEVNNLDNA